MGHVGSGQQADWDSCSYHDPARSPPLATEPPHNPLPHSQVATLELSVLVSHLLPGLHRSTVSERKKIKMISALEAE